MKNLQIDDVVTVINKEGMDNDPQLEDSALEIIKKNEYSGVVTKLDSSEDLYFVGFKNELGWVTQGFKEHELERNGNIG